MDSFTVRKRVDAERGAAFSFPISLLHISKVMGMEGQYYKFEVPLRVCQREKQVERLFSFALPILTLNL